MSASAQTRIKLRSGMAYFGRIVADSDDVIVLRTADSVEMTFKRSTVESIDVMQVRTDSARRAYPSIGVTLGTPAGINLIGAYYFGDLGLRASIGYWGSIYGAQVNLTRNLSTSGNVTHNVSIGAGYMYLRIHRTNFDAWEVTEHDDISEWRYLCATYALNWSGFFAEIGVSVGSGTFSNPQLLFQIGYVHDFRF